MRLLPSSYFLKGLTSTAEFDLILMTEGIRRFSLSLISGRCGSTYLAEMAKRCGLGSGGEPFNELSEASWRRIARPTNFAEFLRLAVREFRCGSTLHIQSTPQRLGALFQLIPREVFQRRPISAILRRDILAQGLSFWYAMRTGRWHSTQEVEPPEPTTYVDRRLELLRCIWIALEGEDQCYDILDAPVLELFYEDIVSFPFESVSRYLAWHDFAATPATIRAAIESKELPAKLHRDDYLEQYQRAMSDFPFIEKALALRRSQAGLREARRLLAAEIKSRIDVKA